jgi:hypothetical protein
VMVWLLFNNLPLANQRGLVLVEINLISCAVLIVYSSDYGVHDFTAVHVHADFIADFVGRGIGVLGTGLIRWVGLGDVPITGMVPIRLLLNRLNQRLPGFHPHFFAVFIKKLQHRTTCRVPLLIVRKGGQNCANSTLLVFQQEILGLHCPCTNDGWRCSFRTACSNEH